MIYLIVAMILLTNYLAYKIGEKKTRMSMHYKIFKAGLHTAYHAFNMGVINEPKVELTARPGRERMLNMMTELDTKYKEMGKYNGN